MIMMLVIVKMSSLCKKVGTKLFSNLSTVM